jgi:hypothetical protein
MIEAEWLCCTDPLEMLAFLGDRASDRQLRLLLVGHCRRSWHLLSPGSRASVEVAERFADGGASAAELLEADYSADSWMLPEDDRCQEIEAELQVPSLLPDEVARLREQLERQSGRLHAAMRARSCCLPPDMIRGLGRGELVGGLELFAAILRDLIGNPFRTISVDLGWLVWGDAVVPGIARAIYDGHDFERLPILGDALEEAGCQDAEILAHCRGPGPHVRGCWVLSRFLELSPLDPRAPQE